MYILLHSNVNDMDLIFLNSKCIGITNQLYYNMTSELLWIRVILYLHRVRTFVKFTQI